MTDMHSANTIQRSNAGLMLVQRRRRWTNIKLALVECLLLAGHLMCGDLREVILSLNIICLKLCLLFF